MAPQQDREDRFKHSALTVKQQLKKASKKSGELGLAPTKNGKARTITLAPTVLQYFRLQRLRQNGLRMEAGDLWIERQLVFTNQTGDYLSCRADGRLPLLSRRV